MGYDHTGKRLKSQQKTVKPPHGLTKKQTEKWLDEQAILFEMACKSTAPVVDRKTTLAQYTEFWLREIAPEKMARSTLIREKQDIARFLPELGHYKLTELRPEIFRKYYTKLRKTISDQTGKPPSESTKSEPSKAGPILEGRRRLRIWSFRGSYANPGNGMEQASSDAGGRFS